MDMIWQNWNDFFAMGGYALYVWGSVVVMFGALAIEVAMLSARRKAARTQLTRWVSNAMSNNARRNGREDGNENQA
jgi:heme exporter protein D